MQEKSILEHTYILILILWVCLGFYGLNKQGTIKASAVYVLPENFGFGFRNANDKIWGLWNTDNDTRVAKIWGDVNQLLDEYGFSLDIVYSDLAFDAKLPQLYDKVFFWNETIN